MIYKVSILIETIFTLMDETFTRWRPVKMPVCQPFWINSINRIIPNIPIKTHIPASKADGVFGVEATGRGHIKPVPHVHQVIPHLADTELADKLKIVVK